MGMAALAVAVGYGLGSLAFAVLVSRAMHLADPRSYGSKNPGATNMLRSGSKLAAVLTLLLDASKGAVAVWLAQAAGWVPPGSTVLYAVGLAAFVGHLYPVFFGFQGGKGVATAAGVLLALQPVLGLATLATFGLILFFFRYVSLASMVAAVFAPFYLLFGNGVWWQTRPMAVVALAVMAGLLVWRHQTNISRLLAGTEGKLGNPDRQSPTKSR
jgi:glycerol-3-phosphate acyltransferase PlsY